MADAASGAGRGVAVIGMAGRFPGAGCLEQFWDNLRNGVESITQFSDSEMSFSILSMGEEKDPDYVKAGGVLEGIDLFDASFFGFNAREAEITDPQDRLFLECAWQALESAGHDPGRHDGPIGVFAAEGLNGYLVNNLLLNPALLRTLDIYQLIIASDKDYLATRVSHALNLRGPSLTVQTACSSSLVAVHLACQSLLQGECDMALAGGVSIRVPHHEGHLYKPGGIVSPDGHTRAFDAKAAGTLFSSGLGVVLLRRLSDAVADGDPVRAVIRGSAVNNDGSAKTGFTAPSMTGQVGAVTRALDVAGVGPETITFVETHGTGTLTGDPTEVEALTRVFRSHTTKKSFCGIGTVKTNIGHLNTASGVAGLIKTVLSLEHRLLPATLHFQKPNPAINFQESPFYVNAKLSEWCSSDGVPRRAAVTSMGIGGTNASIIVEEAPRPQPGGAGRSTQILNLSARTASELETVSERLASHLETHPQDDLADVCYTLNLGRKAFRYRRVVSCLSTEDAVAALRSKAPQRVFTGLVPVERPPVVFMFPGQGSGHVNMTLDLYREEADFRRSIDRCADILQREMGVDLREIIYPADGKQEEAARELARAEIAQPALFMVSYALAELWMKWGIRPDAVVGYSTGEFAAACVAGVFSLEEALKILVVRGRLTESLPPGAMLVVSLPEKELTSHLGPDLSIAVVGGPADCVVSGVPEQVEELEDRLRKLRVPCKRLPISRAYHSVMVDPVLDGLAEVIAKARLKTPEIPMVSTLTGTWAGPELTDPAYWTGQFRRPVRFFDAMDLTMKDMKGVLLEVGPGQALLDIVSRNFPRESRAILLPTCRRARQTESDLGPLVGALGRLWLAGVPVDWSAYYAHQRRRRLSLPTYPFSRRRYWVEPQAGTGVFSDFSRLSGKRSDVTDWFYVPSWRRLPLEPPVPAKPSPTSSWLVFLDQDGPGAELVRGLERDGHDVTVVTCGDKFELVRPRVYRLDPLRPDDCLALMRDLSARGGIPANVLHLWTLDATRSTPSDTGRRLDRGYYSLLSIVQALVKQNVTHSVRVWLVCGGTQELTGQETLCPENAALLGPCTVIPQEYPNIACRILDIDPVELETPRRKDLLRHLLAEMNSTGDGRIVAFRGNHRWVQSFESVRLERQDPASSLLRMGGVYLITGGLGEIGLMLAQHLTRIVKAKVVLVGRSGLPAEEEWSKWLSSHGPLDPLSRRIRRVREMVSAGAEVLVLQADVSDETRMRRAFDQACKRFGTVHGVFHAAGVLEKDAFASVGAMGRRESEAHFQPKVWGLMTLEKVLEGRDLDFCLLLSSISAVLGGLGYSGYAAGNAFMDAFVHKHDRTGTVPWISVNWDTWQVDAADGAQPTEFAMTPQQGMDAFERVLTTHGLRQIIVSTGDLHDRLKKWVANRTDKGVDEPQSDKTLTRYDRPELVSQYTPPSNETQTLIANVWQELLGINQVGIHDNFFELGGHSLLATQVMARLRKAVRVDLPITVFFDAPTVAGLAQLVDKARSSDTRTDLKTPADTPPAPGGQLLPRVAGSPRKTDVPLAYSQQTLWLLHQLVPGLAAYNIPTGLRVKGPLNVQVLERALDQIIRRHEALRTTFCFRNTHPVQLVNPDQPSPLGVVDLTDLPHDQREQQAHTLAAREAAGPMSLTDGPLTKTLLFKLGGEDHLLLFIMHHMVFDGWSLEIFFRELATLYQALSQGGSSPLAGPPVQFADFTVWQQEWVQGERLEKLLSYWTRRLAGLPTVIDLPSDRPRPSSRTFQGDRHSVWIPEDFCRSLETFSRREEATLFMTLLGTFQTLLFRHTGQTDQVLGSPIAGRDLVELEGTIGFLMNMLVLRNDLSGDPTFRELLKRVRENTLAAYAHQGLPLQLLLDHLRPEITMSHMPLFQTAFMLQNMPGEGLRLPGLEVQPVAVETGTSKFDLSVIAYPVPGGLMFTWEYSKDIFDAHTVRRLAGEYRGLLDAVLSGPDRRLSQLPMSFKDE